MTLFGYARYEVTYTFWIFRRQHETYTQHLQFIGCLLISSVRRRLGAFYTVSQKTSHLWLAITLTHMNGFWHFWQKCYW